MSKYITNINTLSALLDRMISENIKLYFFSKDGDDVKVEHQKQVIEEIKGQLSELFLDVYDGRYDYIPELRTYKSNEIVNTLQELIISDIYTGEGDRANLQEAMKDEPLIEAFIYNHKLLRKANETRAAAKNSLDRQFKEFVDGE
jgi:hypothetical protein